MGLNWVRVDSAFARNHTVIELADRKQWQAITAYVCGLGYSAEHGLDGFIPKAALPFIHCSPAIAKQLVNVELWHQIVGGWDIHDWSEYQPSNEENQKRKNRAKAAAELRWAKARGQGVVTELKARR